MSKTENLEFKSYASRWYILAVYSLYACLQVSIFCIRQSFSELFRPVFSILGVQ